MPEEDKVSDSHQQAVDFVDRYLAAYHAKDWDGVRACLTDDVVAADAGVGIHLEGADAVIAGHIATAERFPDRRYKIEGIAVDGDLLSFWGLWTGTLAAGKQGPSAHWHDADSDQVGPFRFCRAAELRDGRFASYTDYTVDLRA